MEVELDDRFFSRVSKLFDVQAFAHLRVLIAGCGSGGGQVASELVMSGVKNFVLVDNDVLEPENVIRHVCGIRYLGQKKTEALSDVLKDRNPLAKVQKCNADLLSWDGLEAEIQQADVVVLATDNEPSRYRVNEVCVNKRVPFVVGRVFTRGIGGEAFAYRPGQGGCLACLEQVLERTQFRDGVREIDLVTDEERDEMYGLNANEIKDSPGLVVDIAFIAAFHTRLVLDALASAAPERPAFLTPIQENYIVWGNRAVHPFKKNFQLQRINLLPQEGCAICGVNDES